MSDIITLKEVGVKKATFVTLENNVLFGYYKAKSEKDYLQTNKGEMLE